MKDDKFKEYVNFLLNPDAFEVEYECPECGYIDFEPTQCPNCSYPHMELRLTEK